MLVIKQPRTVNQDRTVFYYSQAFCFVPLYATITGFRGEIPCFITHLRIASSYEHVVLPVEYLQLMYKSKNSVIVEKKYSHSAAMFDHVTLIFLHKPILYGVVC